MRLWTLNDTGDLRTRVVIVLAIMIGAGCAQAQENTPAAHAPDTLFQAIARQLSPDPVEPKDFVKQSRPATTDYLPIGIVPPDRPLRVKSPAEVKAMETELDAARAVHDKISGRLPPQAKAKASKPKSLAGATMTR